METSSSLPQHLEPSHSHTKRSVQLPRAPTTQPLRPQQAFTFLIISSGTSTATASVEVGHGMSCAWAAGPHHCTSSSGQGLRSGDHSDRMHVLAASQRLPGRQGHTDRQADGQVEGQAFPGVTQQGPIRMETRQEAKMKRWPSELGQRPPGGWSCPLPGYSAPTFHSLRVSGSFPDTLG